MFPSDFSVTVKCTALPLKTPQSKRMLIVKIMSGVYRLDEGERNYNIGKTGTKADTAASVAQGIQEDLYQESLYFQPECVWENIAAITITTVCFVNRRRLRRYGAGAM